MSDVSRLVPGVRTARGKEDVDMECLFQVCEHAAVSLRAMADPIHRIGSDLWGQICSEINTPSAGWQWRRPRAYAIPKCSIVG